MRKRKSKKESKSFRRSGLVTGLGPIRQLQEHKLDLALELKLKQNAIQCDAMLLYGSSSSSKESKKIKAEKQICPGLVQQTADGLGTVNRSNSSPLAVEWRQEWI